MSLPSDHYEADARPGIQGSSAGIIQPRLGPIGWVRFVWRQLTSMRTALFLLMLLAVAAVPGSLVPQTGADPNGVLQYQQQHPTLYPILNAVQAFDVYSSVWFTAIYLLLFISLVGCVIPRLKHHWDALRAAPPRTPARLSRLAAFSSVELPGAAAGGLTPEQAIASAHRVLRGARYRVARFDTSGWLSVSAERGYLRESGNLVFHIALLGVLFAVGIGGGFGYTGQKIVVVGDSFVNSLASYDSINPGRFFSDHSLEPYAVRIDSLDVKYDTSSEATGAPLDYTAHVTTREPHEATERGVIKVNDPLSIAGTQVYLLGNGYAPTVTVRNPSGQVVYQDSVPFLPQDSNLTSLGIIKVPDGLAQQVGMRGFFYPTKGGSSTAGAFASTYPGLKNPYLTLNVYTGDLKVNDGAPVSVYALDTTNMRQVAGPGSSHAAIELKPGETEALPDGLGSITFTGAQRYASLEIHHDPAQGFVLVFAFLILAGLLTSLFIPRRRVWVKAWTLPNGNLHVEYAGLARGEDPGLNGAVSQISDRHLVELTASRPPSET